MKLCLNVRLYAALLSFTLLGLVACEKDELVSPISNTISKEDGSLAPNAPKGTFFYGLTANNELVGYTSGNPLKDHGAIDITGLASGENILAIDFRPATGQLYGVSNLSRLYTINPSTGATLLVGSGAFTPAISGDLVGFDFNPTVDRIRLVTSNEQNLRLHPETGTVAAVDGNLNPGDRTVVAAAYTNNFAGATSTTLYDIDLSDDMLYKQNPPNNGTLEAVGPLGILATGEGGFDISPDNTVALAVLFGREDDGSGQESSNGNKTRFYYIDLQTGTAQNAGKTERQVIGLAIPTRPVAYAIDMMNQLVIFNPMNPSSLIKKPVGGLQTDETLLGIDMRPATGQLYALGSSSRIYSINMASGMASVIGTGPFTTSLNGSSFGFDFNPTVDRIRIISNTGQNLRVHPVTGAIAAVDTPLNPGMPNVDASAYTNNFAGATSTTLYNLDFNSDKLYIQNPPNMGTQVEVGSTGLNLDAANGFDIGSNSGTALAILSSGSETGMYRINLSSGAATFTASFPEKVKGFTLGLGF